MYSRTLGHGEENPVSLYYVVVGSWAGGCFVVGGRGVGVDWAGGWWGVAYGHNL
jgi:hypothetical protein